MGMVLNPRSDGYRMAEKGEVFVDKSEMIAYLNTLVDTPQKYVSVSRPRRFGKTMAVGMICAYYGMGEDNRSLFEDKKLANLEGWDAYLGKFDVIRLTITDYMMARGRSLSIPEMLVRLTKLLMRELTVAYSAVDFFDDEDIVQSMQDIYGSVGGRFVVVIDEWDAPFRERPQDKEGQREYLDFLRNWMKDKDYIALSYMTGILPIKKYGKHSALNMFDEYSMTSPKLLARYMGFTGQEVEELCVQKGVNYEGLRRWYDGYHLTSKSSPDEIADGFVEKEEERSEYEIYAPFSVVSALRFKMFENYWNETETWEALAEYIRRDYDGLKEDVAILMDGGNVSVDITGYQNDMTTFMGKDDILTLLIHLGYLSYDSVGKTVRIPNKEVLQVFRISTRSDEWAVTMRALAHSQKLLEATWAYDEETVARLVEAAHDRTGKLSYNSEAGLSYAVQLAYYRAQDYYTLIPEMDSGKGYADLTYIPAPGHADKPAILVELKYDKDADTAIDQILRQRYPDRLEHYRGNIILVGINYDSEKKNNDKEFKHHSCRMMRA